MTPTCQTCNRLRSKLKRLLREVETPRPGRTKGATDSRAAARAERIRSLWSSATFRSKRSLARHLKVSEKTVRRALGAA